jgi:hypothetical protein
MNTLIGSTVNPFFGQVRTLSPTLVRVACRRHDSLTLRYHLEALPLMNSSLMSRSKTAQPIKKIADFGGIEPHSASPPIPHHRQLEYQCGGSTPEV